MKKFISIILSVICVVTILSGISVLADNSGVKVYLDENEVVFPDAQPFIDARERTLVPIRFVSEALGAKVDWDNDTKTVLIEKDNDKIRYTINEFRAYLNDKVVSFDSFGILKENRTFVPLRFISEMLMCDVNWNDSDKIVSIKSPGKPIEFPEPVITVHYPESEADKRLFWITLDNYREFQRECPNYEFKVEFVSPTEFNSYEQYEGSELGWQKYDRTEYNKITSDGDTIFSVSRGYYTTQNNIKKFKPTDGTELKFKLTVLKKCNGKFKEYEYSENLKMTYPLI